MNTKSLKDLRVAVLATDGFEKSELLEPKKALEEAGAVVKVVSLKSGKIKSWDNKDWGMQVPVDLTLQDADPGEFDALMLPGGVMNPDSLRQDEAAVAFVSAFTNAGKPIGAICHGPWTLIETDFLKGKTVTSWPSLRTDLTNAGAHWVDREVVLDGSLVTSRKPQDLPAFNKQLIQLIAETAGNVFRHGSTKVESHQVLPHH